MNKSENYNHKIIKHNNLGNESRMKFLADNPLQKIKILTDFVSKSGTRHNFNYKSYVYYDLWNGIVSGFDKEQRRSNLLLNSRDLIYPPYFDNVKSIIYCLMTNPIIYSRNPAQNKILNWYDFTYESGTQHSGTCIYSAFDKGYYLDRIQSQMDFYKKIKDTNKLEIGPDDLTNYEKFIYLIKKHKTMLVPTFKMDVIWHAHMLNSPQYMSDTTSVLGYPLNHDDTLSTAKLRQGMANTANIWNKEFGGGFGPFQAMAMAATGIYVTQVPLSTNMQDKQDKQNSGSCGGMPDTSTSSIMMASTNSSCGASTCGGSSSCGGGSSGGSSCGGCGGCGA